MLEQSSSVQLNKLSSSSSLLVEAAGPFWLIGLCIKALLPLGCEIHILSAPPLCNRDSTLHVLGGHCSVGGDANVDAEHEPITHTQSCIALFI